MNTINVEESKTPHAVKCFVCDVPLARSSFKRWKHVLYDITSCSKELLCSKMGDMIGDAFKMYVTADDQICTKCESIVNEYDQMIIQIDKIKSVFMQLLQKKYNLGSPCVNGEDISDTGNCSESNEMKTPKPSDIDNSQFVTIDVDSPISQKENSESSSQELALRERRNKRRKIQAVFKCSKCSFVTYIENVMRSHVSNHVDTSIRCIICDSLVNGKPELKTHLMIHDNTVCPICARDHKKPYLLQYHILTQHARQENESIPKSKHNQTVISTHNGKKVDTTQKNDDKLQSNDNGTLEENEIKAKQTSENESYKESETKSGKPKNPQDLRFQKGTLWSCPYCPVKCRSKVGATHHIVKHTGKHKLFCEVCKKGFMTNSRLSEHMGAHTKELRYICEICGQQFCFHSTLTLHILWHSDPKPFPCSVCGKKFTNTSVRKHHMRKEHTGELPYICEFCDKPFYRSKSFKYHMMIHTNTYPFTCELCSHGFVNKSKYAQHLAKVHDDSSLLNPKKRVCEYKMKIRPNKLIEAIETVGKDHTYDMNNDPEFGKTGNEKLSELTYFYHNLEEFVNYNNEEDTSLNALISDCSR